MQNLWVLEQLSSLLLQVIIYKNNLEEIRLSGKWMSAWDTYLTMEVEFGDQILEIMSSSVQFSCSVVSDSLWPHGLQHTSPPCPSPTPGVYSNSCPSSRWCHPTASSSVVPFFSHFQSFPASGSFQMSQFFASGGQSIGGSTLASVLPMNIQGWYHLGLIESKFVNYCLM